MHRPFQQRAAGVLLPVASLPSPHGIGGFGDAAYRWVDFLCAAGQKYWQILPLGPTSFGDSPYQSFSAFAGNPYFIDLDLLCRQGLLKGEECRSVRWGENPRTVDYKTIFYYREPLLRKAFTRFRDRNALEEFRERNRDWLEDYALYMAVKAQMGLRPWSGWEEDIRLRRPEAMERYRLALWDDVEYHIFVQYLFFRQWRALKSYANDRGLEIIGDIPIYVAMDSADTWANSQWFLLDGDKNPIQVAGVPPDGFSATGQLWGNPIYDWERMEADGYRWWLARLRHSLALYDVLRIDHFRGFESFYAVSFGQDTAAGGQWRKGPGMRLIDAVNRAFGGEARIIAEDLGYLTDEVRELLRQSGYPGMKVLQFAFDSREASNYMTHNYGHHCVVYTGTHDNDTIRGWFSSAPEEDVALALEYMGLRDDKEGNLAFIRLALASVADLAVIPIQDYLDLDSSARINIPSTLGGNNWRWRLLDSDLTGELQQTMHRMTKLYGRQPEAEGGDNGDEPVST